MSSDRAVRAARRARRSSLPARVISGVSLDVSLALESDDDDFWAMTWRATQNLSRLAAVEKAATCSSFVACR